MNDESNKMMKVTNLHAGYGQTRVLENICFGAEANQILCILGPNGCGKTTLLRAISGLLPYEGSICIEDSEVKQTKRKFLARKVAIMTQLSSLYFSYTVYETVQMGRYIYQEGGFFHTSNRDEKEFVLSCIEQVGLLEKKDCLITELSGGQLQRVFLARVLAQDPDIILLDEPTNHLDLKYQIELLEYLKVWVKQGNRCVVGVLHDISQALLYADQILLLDQGKVCAYDKASEFDLQILNETYGIDIKEYMLRSLTRWRDI